MFSRLSTYWAMLKNDPVYFLIFILYFAVTVLLSLILHEIAHGYVALRCGDPTAKWMGRLSLDPRKHLDPMGTVFMLLLGFGWAKPVPVNPRNFRNGRRDDFLVSIAGIVMNLTLFILCSLLSVIVTRVMWTQDFLKAFQSQYGSLQGLVNMFTGGSASNWAYYIAYGMISPSSQYLAVPWLLYVQRFLLLMMQINVSLAVFNLLPIPPLDGYHLVNDTILKGRFQLTAQTFRIAQGILLLLCFSGALSNILSVCCKALTGGVVNLFLLLMGGA